MKYLIAAAALGTLVSSQTALLAEDATAAAACPAAAAACTVAAQPAQACCAEAGAACCPAPSAVKLTKVNYEVSGLSCAAGENQVASALTAIEGVSEAKACSVSKNVAVAYNAKTVKEKDLLAAIIKAGFQVDAEKVELAVNGMSCGACSTKISEALTSLEGVKEQEVCHEGKNAVVKFDPNKITREQLVAAITKTGFTVVE